MASALFRLGRFAYRRKWWVISIWLVILIGLGSAVGVMKPSFVTDFELPGTDSGIATEQVAEYFPEVEQQQMEASTSIVVAAEDGLAAHSAQLDRLAEELRGLPEVVEPQTVVNPVVAAAADPAMAAAVLGDDGRVGLIQVRQGIEITELTLAEKDQLVEILENNRGDGLQVEATGSLMMVQELGGTAELIGFAVAFVVMIVAFGALVASFIPLITGIVGVGITMMLLLLGADALSINQAATAIVTMLGIAVSIDYALFVVSRYRSEFSRGGNRADAVGRAVGTAGTAVVFAGLTVIIAVVALTVVGIPFVTQMGVGAAIAVAIAVIGAITLIPALLGAVGRFAFTPRIPWIRHADPSAAGDTVGQKYGRAVVRRPWPFVLIGLVVLAIAAIPMQKLELGMSMSSDDEVAAQQLLQRGFGEGINGPLLVVMHSDDDGPVNDAADAALTHIRSLPGVAYPEQLMWLGNGAPPQTQDGADAALFIVTPMSNPSSQQTHDLMEEIRAYIPQAQQDGAELHVGGQTAIMSDLSAKLSDALIPYLIVVVGLAFLIMVLVFRSLWVPLIGTIGFVFSILATFGITVWVFQEGALGIVNYPKPILSFLPIFLIGVVFGLAMDYQVFLATRMREEFIHGMTVKDAVIAGYRHGARVVTSAAIIMISVFAAFMLSPDTTAKMIGFAMAIAVLFDAFIIRMTVVPAMISVLGERAWSLPGWIDRLVPNVDIEGSKVRHIGVLADHEEPVMVGASGGGNPDR